MTQPAATESPPITKPPTDKRIVLEKSVGGKWEMKLSGPVRRLDINHLRKFLHLEYVRTKRRERMKAATMKRTAETKPPVKETKNAS